MVQYTVYLDHSVKLQQKGLLVVQINYVKQCYLKFLAVIVTKIFGLDVTFAHACVWSCLCMLRVGIHLLSKHCNFQSYSVYLTSIVMATPSHCVFIDQLLVLSLAELLTIVI